MKTVKKLLAAFMTLVIISAASVTAFASSFDDLAEGTYSIDAKLSCYVNAMGGVEFGAPLLTSASLEVAHDGTKTMTLHFTKSQVTIYSITCDTFIDFSPTYVTKTNGIESGTLGYYNADGVLVTDTIDFTLSDDTAENAQKEPVHYVDSLSFPIEYESDKYNLTLFVNSNVMGTQFTKGGYEATLRVDWSSISADAAESSENEVALEVPEATEAPSSSVNVENKDGLNIYHAGDESVSDIETDITGTYIAYFKEPLLIAIGAAAGVMILTGVILIIAGRKEKK